MKKVISIIFLLLGITVFSQDVKPYQIYNSKGKRISFEKMIDGLQKSDVVLFGEHHDNSIVHWLQLKVTKSLAKKRALTLGAEMFESDNQKVLNDYLLGKINQKQLDTLARLWNNYKTDYKPIVDFAKEKQIKAKFKEYMQWNLSNWNELYWYDKDEVKALCKLPNPALFKTLEIEFWAGQENESFNVQSLELSEIQVVQT